MRERQNAILAILAVWVCACLFGIATPSVAGTTGAVRGYVRAFDHKVEAGGYFDLLYQINHDSLHPAESAEIQLFSGSTGEIRHRADKNGFFTFLGLPPDRYFLWVPGQFDQFGRVHSFCLTIANVHADQTTNANLYAGSTDHDLHCLRRPAINGDRLLGPDQPFDVYEFRNFADGW